MSFCGFEKCDATFSLIHIHFVVKLIHFQPKLSKCVFDISAMPPTLIVFPSFVVS